MSTTTSVSYQSHHPNRTITQCKVKRRNHLGGKDFTPDLHRHENTRFTWQYGDLYDYDDGYAFLCAKGESPEGEMGSPMILPSRWNRASQRASALEMNKFKRNLNVNSNIYDEYHTDKDWGSKSPRNGSHSKGDCSRENELLASDVGDDCRIIFGRKSHADGRLEKLDKTVEYCTCMFCVRGIFYNFVDDEDDCNSVSDSPCRCSDPGVSCTKRWSILALLACLMPCLFFYPPLRGCLALCKKCRAKRRAKEGDVSVRMLKGKKGQQQETDV